MARPDRHSISGYVWHIAHRCHEESVATTREKLGSRAKGRQVLRQNGSYELREGAGSHEYSFEPKNGGLRVENTYFWSTIS